MKFSIFVLLFSALGVSAQAKQVDCTLVYAVKDESKDDLTLSFPVNDVLNCKRAEKILEIEGTDLQLKVVYSASCDRVNGAFPEHLRSVQIQDSGREKAFARAFSLRGYPKQLSLQHFIPGRQDVNAIAHCEIK